MLNQLTARCAAADSVPASRRDRAPVAACHPRRWCGRGRRFSRIAGHARQRDRNIRDRGRTFARLCDGDCARLRLRTRLARIHRPAAARAARGRARTCRSAELSSEASRDQQIAPGFDRGFGFLDVFEKDGFAVIAAPAAGFEQFGEMVQPLFGKLAPARDDVAATCHVGSMCHENARMEKNGRRRNRTEST